MVFTADEIRRRYIGDRGGTINGDVETIMEPPSRFTYLTMGGGILSLFGTIRAFISLFSATYLGYSFFFFLGLFFSLNARVTRYPSVAIDINLFS